MMSFIGDGSHAHGVRVSFSEPSQHGLQHHGATVVDRSAAASHVCLVSWSTEVRNLLWNVSDCRNIPLALHGKPSCQAKLQDQWLNS